MKPFRSLFSVLCLLPSAYAADLPDLGQGLAYLRVNSLLKSSADLNAALLRPAPLVLDLRYTADEPAGVDVLRTLNSQPAKPTLYVLVSPATPVPLAAILSSTSTRLVTLGVKGSHPAAQVIVEQTAETDRAAYVALDSGTPLAQLLSGKIEKERFDEATLVHEFKNGNHEAHPPALSQAEGPEATPTPGKENPAPSAAPLTDRVLQRALHLHRALLALKHG